MSSNADQVLQAYIKANGQIPDQPNALVAYSRQHLEIPTIIYSEAKKALSKITTSIKLGGIKKKKKSCKWLIGDEVLISKDRTGVLRYIGKVPEMGDDNIWYGLELTSGTIGQHDGSIKGKRYFQTNGKRGMFIPERKLRRRLNRKDKERRNSYAEISNHVKQLQKEYAGQDAAILYPSSAQQTNIHTLVFENPEHAQKYGDGVNEFHSATFTEQASPKIVNNDDINDQNDNHQNDQNKKKKKKKKNKKKNKKIERTRTGSSGSSGSSTSYSRDNNNNHHHNNNDRDNVEVDVEEYEDTEISELDENEDHDDDGPTVKTFDTLLKYILRQKGQYREGLLDVYGNPATHSLIVEAFSSMKQLQPNEQAFLWPALLKRWSKYTHKI